MTKPKLTLSVSVAGVVMAVDVDRHATVGDLIKQVLSQAFTPESCPDDATCRLALQVDDLAHDMLLEELPADGAMLSLKLPF